MEETYPQGTYPKGTYPKGTFDHREEDPEQLEGFDDIVEYGPETNDSQMGKDVDSITRDIKVAERITDTVIEICDKFKYEISRCVTCPILLECSYPKKRLNSLKAEAKSTSEEIYDEEIELDDSAENVLRAQNRRDYVYRSYIQDRAHEVLKNDRCIFERREILLSLQKFTDAGYDISDPRTYLIIKELIGNILNSGRANKAFTNLGLLLKKDTPGGPIYYKNPLLTSKIEISRLIIESTEALDRILKSDEAAKADKSFTEHLMKELQIRQRKKSKLIENIRKDVEDGNH